MNARSRGWLPVALVLLASGCSSGSKATRGGGSLEARAQELEEQNRALQEQLRQKQAEIEQSFVAVTQAEAAARLQGLGCVAVMPAGATVRGMPRSGEVHARLALRHQSYRMTATFSPARTSGGWRMAQGNCRMVSP